ncbi:MAG: hypothetical protein Q8R76_02900, partial [Candidatus Omnitrophota bacterium]|nr:hypothetical protein [Candidatus Omnitrophota bacterium]
MRRVHSEYPIRHSLAKRCFAGILAFLVLWSQVIDPAFAASYYEQTYTPPPVSIKDAEAESVKEATSKDPLSNRESQFFLDDELSLSAPSASTEQDAEEVGDQDDNENRGTERYSVEESIDHLSPDFAYAGILADAPDTRTQFENLARSVENAIIGIDYSELVHLTSGAYQEILLHPVAGAWLQANKDKITLIAHNHPVGQSALPSLADIEAAAELGDSIRYFSYGIGNSGDIEVYEFNGSGILNESQPYDWSYLSVAMQADHNPIESTKATRDMLSEFIEAVDLYNDEPYLADPFLHAGPTILPGHPTLGSFASSSPSATLNVTQSSTSLFRMDYNVTNAGSFVGSIINWGSSPANLSGFSTISFEIRVINPCVAVNCLKVEFVDSANRVVAINVTGLTAGFQQKDFNTATITGINPAFDLNNVKQINFVIDNAMAFPNTNNAMEIKSGGLHYDPIIDPDPALNTGDITKLPATSTGVRPDPITFASGDGSSATIQKFSETFAQVTYNGANGNSFGGIFMDYDNPATGGTVEAINFNTLFPTGLVLDLDNAGGSITRAQFEVTDATGKRDVVFLDGIAAGGQRWKINPSDFDLVDATKITVISLVVTGAATNQKLSINWGNFAFIPPLPPDPSQGTGDITPVPLNSFGSRPALNAFASGDGSSTTINQFSETFAQVTYNGTAGGSFGGVFLNYDDLGTGAIETINLSTAFSGGLVLQLDSGNETVDNILLEVTDKTGKTDQVRLKDIESFGQRWKILPAQFDEVDITKITVISLVIEGNVSNGQLAINWGNFAFTPPIPPDPSQNTGDITKLPANSLGFRPVLTGFAKADGSTAGVQMFSQTFGRLTYSGNNGTSYGGAFLNYDDPATGGTTESINFDTLFPSGLVLEMDSPGSTLSTVLLEVTDSLGRIDQVELVNLESFGQRWKILTTQFDEVDTTKIVVISFVIEGSPPGATLSINWGDFAFTPPLPPDPSLNTGDITKLPANSLGRRPPILGFASGDGSTASLTNFSETFSQLNYTGVSGASFGGVFINYDNPDTGGVEGIDFNTLFPTGVVLELDSPNSAFTEILLEITDATGKTDSVRLTGLDSFGQRWKILPSQWDEIDVTKVSVISLVVKGAAASGQLSINWGDFAFTPSVNPDGALNAGDITKLPLNSLGGKPTLLGFASNDGSSANAVLANPSEATLTYDGTGSASFGGTFVNYDNLDTTPAVEFTDLNAAFPGGIVFGLTSPGAGITEILLEVTDATGKTDQVRVSGITAGDQFWKVLPTLFDEVDRSKITVISIVVLGEIDNKNLDINWGDYAFRAQVPPDPTLNVGDITKLPLLGSGERPEITGFAKLDGTTSVVSLASETFAQIDYNGAVGDSFGGAFITYDDATTTTTVETINFTSEFPTGLVIGVETVTGGANTGSVIAEVTDNTGARASVELISLQTFGQRYKMTADKFFGVDMTKIATMSFLLEGAGTKTLKVDWGNWDFTEPVNPDPALTVGDITKLPLLGSGERPDIVGFAKEGDGSTSVVTKATQSFAQIDYNGGAADSFGGAFITYDDATTTTTVETIDFTAEFPTGLVIGVESVTGGANATSVFVEVTDNTGATDTVELVSIATFGQRYKILSGVFFNVDMTKISTMSFLFEGSGTNTLKVDRWNWDFTETENPDPTL